MRIHSLVEPPKVSPGRLPAARECRERAQELLQDADPMAVELGALQLFENAVRGSLPAQTDDPSTFLPEPSHQPQDLDPKRPLSATSGYLTGLATAAGVSGGLNGVVLSALGEFSAQTLWGDDGPSKSGMRVFGDIREIDRVASQLAPRFSLSLQGQEVLVTGSVKPEERTLVAGALKELCDKIGPEAFAQLKKVHFRSYLGWMGGSSALIAGLAALSTPHSVYIANSQLQSLDSLRDILFHEFGHLKDAAKAGFFSNFYASTSPTSPFGSGGELDYVSDYARSKTIEDLAETHSYVIKNWDAIQRAPQMWIHANGALGEKTAWILEKFYGQEVPGPGQRLKAALKDVDNERTPFSNREEFQEQLQLFLRAERPLSADTTDPQRAKQQQYLSKLAESTLGDPPAPSWWRRLLPF